ncbi:uncharacterized protein LOC131314395 isoform X2 [Rhododendron vialii]|uniref:uncharacterized protein LOC131314395 isoform X2 n=1 Tax=Rhododendron vialii TaxID=182163 RepID=UPI00265F9E62|nr:uncharacterized protein LOC131314395 isoform X2 [Rhododendron vialii]
MVASQSAAVNGARWKAKRIYICRYGQRRRWQWVVEWFSSGAVGGYQSGLLDWWWAVMAGFASGRLRQMANHLSDHPLSPENGAFRLNSASAIRLPDVLLLCSAQMFCYCVQPCVLFILSSLCAFDAGQVMLSSSIRIYSTPSLILVLMMAK